MGFSIRCTCGRDVPFHAGQAGTEVACPCGLVVPVPSLGEIRELERRQPAAPPNYLTVGPSHLLSRCLFGRSLRQKSTA